MTLSIGIDVGGTKVLGGVVDESGKILETLRLETPREGGSALTQTIVDVAHQLLAKYPAESVGISAAGLVSSDRRTMLATPNIADWNGAPLGDQLTNLIGLPVVLENDANAAAWGEARFGAGNGEGNLLLIIVGTGIGGGFLLNGQIYRGAYGVAAEIGHMRVVPEGHLCGCGARGCFEQYASGTAMLRHAREAISASPDLARNLLARGDGTVHGLTGSHITQAAQAGDSVALAALNTTGQWLGAGISSLAMILNPAVVVISGGAIAAGELLLAPAREMALRKLPFRGEHPETQIVAATLGNQAGLVGASDLARQK